MPCPFRLACPYTPQAPRYTHYAESYAEYAYHYISYESRRPDGASRDPCPCPLVPLVVTLQRPQKARHNT